ncbi:MAG: hypothetical protein EAZ30_13870 [Betaproteobacteria bacterium]|nr:MAG: hypothetical protein EAZ30_13870 [Betaproteobacteria bacterium]
MREGWGIGPFLGTIVSAGLGSMTTAGALMIGATVFVAKVVLGAVTLVWTVAARLPLGAGAVVCALTLKESIAAEATVAMEINLDIVFLNDVEN